MSLTRPTLTTSLAFPANPSVSSARPLKRRLSPSPDLAFFTPAADSFNPKPYAPNPVPQSHVENSPKLPPPRNNASLPHHMPLTDPCLSDPNVVFIHPPFIAFPGAHLYSEGLSYSLMAANPEWFLDPNDFISSVSTNPDAIPYPPQLEPPRGWCPAKKKDLRALGPDGWPEGEEPRLRCTFCRRTYAGVNAKSMWRRHVYEKHKIAMSNRRDGNDRNRGGRGSNKDHHRNTVSDKENLSGDLHRVSKTSTDQLNNIKFKSRPFLVPSDSATENKVQDSQEESVATASAQFVDRPDSPQLASSSSNSSSTDAAPGTDVPEAIPSGNTMSDRMNSSPVTVPITLPMSPYDPTLTPSFRHSPPRLPSDQPWRFPSPSHPLHSRARELCLGMLVRGGISPVIKASTNDSSSPSLGTPSIIHTPSSAAGRSKPFSDAFGSSPVIFQASPRQLFSDGHSPFSTFNALDLRKRINDSPLSGLRRRMHHRKPSTMNTSFDLHADWLSDASLSSTSTIGTESPSRSSNEDPFGGLYKPLLRSKTREGDANQRTPSPRGSSSEVESPVVRNARHPAVGAPELEAGLVGLGIGLMAPFRLSTCRTQSNHATEGSSIEKDEEEVERVLTDGSPGSPTEILSSKHLRSPPLKRRRTSME
ncbi:hypothetical protein L210DRAFT_2953777 [Boletus edulis BED1]|uniref:Uncharacterized protein n=1 Tax=Boletus edulis BED1 TaxID=1328754 RepID=A0AAD4C2J0_BOLED|nr:hypothetical protein L210DRAFT_2953777 [Boletus edulis BED1]